MSPAMRFSLVCLIPLLAALPASAMSISLPAGTAGPATAGGFVTTLSPVNALSAGMPVDIVALFQLDYPGFTYANASTAAGGTLTINSLTPFQSGLGGGLSISARFEPEPGSHALHAYEWLQYIMIDPLSTPFQGAVSSPFTDPPPDARDDNLPFYWTDLQRNTAGLGYLAGGEANDDILFADAPRVSNFRAPVSMRLSLYLVDFDSASRSLTIYDGAQYGFEISASTGVPEPPLRGILVVGSLVLVMLKLHNRRFASR